MRGVSAAWQVWQLTGIIGQNTTSLAVTTMRGWLLTVALAAGAAAVDALSGGAGAQEAKPTSDTANRQFTAAAALQNRDRYDLAAEAWAKFLKSHAGDPRADRALYYLGTCRLKNKQYGEAAAAFQQVVTNYPKSEHRQAAQVAAGKCYFLAGKHDLARDALSKSLEERGETAAEAAHWLARSYLKERKPDEALKIAEAAIPPSAMSEFAAPLALDRADALYDQPARRREAAAAYFELSQKYPQDSLAPQALYMAAFASLHAGENAKALEYCEAFLAQFAGTEQAADVGYVAAESELQAGNYVGAVNRYDRLIDQYPRRNDAPTWKVRRGLALHLQQRYSEVVAAIEPLLASLPNKALLAEASYLVGSSQNELKKYEAALKTLAAGLSAEPHGRHAPDILLALALAEQRLNRLAESKAHLNRLIAQFPDSPLLDRAHFRLAENAHATGDSATAKGEYKLMIEKFPTSRLIPNALFDLAWTQLNSGDHEGAVGTLDRLLATYPTSEMAARARYARALAREQLKQFAAAVDDLQAFLQTNPSGEEKSDARYVLALCQAGLNHPADAVETLRSILDDDRKYAGADKVLYELAWAWKSLDQTLDHADKAEETFRRLAKEHPASPLAGEALYQVAEAEYQREQFKQAAAAYYDAMQKAGKTPLGEIAAHQLGWCHYRQHAFKKAQKAFAYQRATWPQGTLASDAAFMEAESLFKLGKYAEALPVYRKVTDPSGKNFAPLAQLHSGQAQARLKQWAASLATLQAAAKRFQDSDLLPELLFEQGWATQNLGQKDAALALYEEVTAKTDGEVAARARFMIGQVYLEKKDHPEAVKNFLKVAYGYGYPQWQARAQYEAGRCFEILGKKDDARKSYQEVVERFPESDKAELAKKRVEAISLGK